MKRILTASLVVLLIAVLAANVVFASDAKPRGGMLRIVGQWGSLTNNFNPFLASGQNAPGTITALYEPLFFISMLDGSITPVLATSYEWQDNNLRLVIKTREGVKWSDGTPFSAHDVAFTFNLMKEHPALDLNAIWSSGVTAVNAIDDTTVEFVFSEPNTPVFQYIAHTMIVPEHIWSKIEEPSTFTNPEPVVTGPFLLERFTSQAVTYKRNPNFWMEDKPYLDRVVYQATKSNDVSLLMLLRKQVDYSHLNIPDPEKTFVARDTKHNHYWWPVTNSNILYLNTTKAPLNDVAFRQAIARAIDKQPLSEKAYYGVIAPAHPTGIVPDQQAQWLDQSLADKFYTYNVEEARSILKSAGYSWDASGALIDPSGKKVPTLRILVGAGWTDFISMAQLISENLRAIGVDMVIEQEPWNSYINSLMGGTYDTAICWGTGSGSTPYYLYYRTLASEFAGVGGGQASSNYSRYVNEKVDEALATFRASSDIEVQKEVISFLQEVVVTDVPFIPLTDRANFNVYQTASLEGWPNADDPYTGGDPGDGLGARFMLLNLYKK